MLDKIVKLFNDNGYELYAVGGCVRDKILNRPTNDIDFTTNALPEVTKKLLEGIGKVFTVGEEYGTIGVMTHCGKVEITTYRGEVYPTDSRKPNVVFGNNLYDDLARRDFTINSLAQNPITSEIIDYFGGLDDIKNKKIRVVGSNKNIFEDDPLRMMRAVRFACQLGFKLDVTIDNPKRLSIISPERISEELNKILTSPNPVRGIKLLCKLGLMEYIIPEFLKLQNIEHGKHHVKDPFNHTLSVIEKGREIHNDVPFLLACLLHDIGKPETITIDENEIHFYGHEKVGAKKAVDILKRLKYDNDTIKNVSLLVRHHMYPINATLTKKSIRHFVFKVGNNILPLIDLFKCDIASSRSPRHEYVKKVEELVMECVEEGVINAKSPLTGNDIMERFNLRPCRLVGEIKTYLTNLVISGIMGETDTELAYNYADKFMKEKANVV